VSSIFKVGTTSVSASRRGRQPSFHVDLSSSLNQVAARQLLYAWTRLFCRFTFVLCYSPAFFFPTHPHILRKISGLFHPGLSVFLGSDMFNGRLRLKGWVPALFQDGDLLFFLFATLRPSTPSQGPFAMADCQVFFFLTFRSELSFKIPLLAFFFPFSLLFLQRTEE